MLSQVGSRLEGARNRDGVTHIVICTVIVAEYIEGTRWECMLFIPQTASNDEKLSQRPPFRFLYSRLRRSDLPVGMLRFDNSEATVLWRLHF